MQTARPWLSSSDKLALAFTIVYVLASALLARRSGNAEFVFYIVVMLVLIVLIGIVHLRVRLHPACLWALSAWGLLHMAGGLVHVSDEVGVLYNFRPSPNLPKYDQALHAYGFAVATWAAWQGLCTRLAHPTATFGMLFLAFCAGIGLGALNEVVEFVAVLTVPETNVGGYENTGWDLVANAVGAALAVIWIRLVTPVARPVRGP